PMEGSRPGRQAVRQSIPGVMSPPAMKAISTHSPPLVCSWPNGFIGGRLAIISLLGLAAVFGCRYESQSPSRQAAESNEASILKDEEELDASVWRNERLAQ